MHAKLRIPQNFSNLLNGSQFEPAVLMFASSVATILDDNLMPFFPGYTDHGRRHVEQLLITEERLVPREVWDYQLLSDADGALIICAALLHDLAMHVREKGFLRLIDSYSDWEPLQWLNTPQLKSWNTLWCEFVMEARRWDNSKRNLILGPGNSDEFVVLSDDKLRPPEEWTKKDKLLVGEFIRRHHGRLAHEIVHYGFPGLDGRSEQGQFPILITILEELADLIGLTARSHTLPLRECLDQLNYYHSGSLRPRNACVIYDMALLRVADYLQIDSDRAPFVLLRLRDPQSPLSIDEWQKHRAVQHVSYDHQDPFSIRIELGAKHKLRTHLQIRQLLKNLQNEIDVSSAVLDEVYGRIDQPVLHFLKLAKCRIRSNLDDPSLRTRLPYVPERLEFAADPHLLFLFVEPLWGAEPSIGIRELLQNAVDAVRERSRYCEINAIDESTLDYPDQDCDVLIELIERSDKTWLLTIRDKGIGMREITVRDYYLKAGATFRHSEAWRKDFIDHEGRSRVLRSGRFGIGVFAAFLLGNQMTVTTRHIADPIGYTFSPCQGADIIEMRPSRVPMGTTVEIVLAKTLAMALVTGAKTRSFAKRAEERKEDLWDWYTLRDPVVRRVIRRMGIDNRLEQRLQWPSPADSTLPPHWRRIYPHGYQEVHWNCEDKMLLACNGLEIRPSGGSDQAVGRIDYWGAGADKSIYWGGTAVDSSSLFRVPSISVFDPEGSLPLTLTRDRLAVKALPFSDVLFQDVVDDLIAFCLVCAPDEPVWNANTKGDVFPLQYGKYHPLMHIPERFRDEEVLLPPILHWFCTKDGVAPLDSGTISLAKSKRIVVAGEISLDHVSMDWPDECIASSETNVCLAWSAFRDPLGSMGVDHELAGDFFFAECVSSAILLLSFLEGKNDHAHFDGPLRLILKLPRGLTDPVNDVYGLGTVSMHEIPTERNESVVIVVEKGKQTDFSSQHFIIGAFASKLFHNAVLFNLQAHLTQLPQIDTSFIGRNWLKYVGANLIPFGKKERAVLTEKVASQHPELEHHIRAWQRESRREPPY